MPHTIVELFLKTRTSGMVFLPVKPLGPFEHVHEGKNKWFKCRPEFYDVLFYDMKQKYFVSDIIRLD